jgi:hypothetical protein
MGISSAGWGGPGVSRGWPGVSTDDGLHSWLDEPSLVLRFANGSAIDPRITFTRASSKTYFDAAGVMQTAGTNVPAFDHNPSTLAPLGLSIHEARTNLALQSEDMATTWTKIRSQVDTNSVVAPDGNTTGDTVKGTAAAEAFAYVTQAVTVLASTAYTFSAYVKKKTSAKMLFQMSTAGTTWDKTIDLDTGTIEAGSNTAPTTSTIEDAGGGWYRVAITASTGVGETTLNISPYIIPDGGSWATNSDANDDFYIWGAQLEAGAFPTPYIKTTTASATRAADVATMTGTNFSDWYNQVEGTFLVEYDIEGFNAATNAPLSISDGTNNERFQFYVATSGAEPTFYAADGGVTQANITFAVPESINTPYKIAGAYKANDFSAAYEGALGTPDATGTLPTATTLYLGAGALGTNHILNGHIRRLVYWPYRLPDTTLQQVSQ